MHTAEVYECDTQIAKELPMSSFRNARILGLVLTAVFAYGASVAIAGPEPTRYFKIKVIDDQTSRGVPLVELKTVHNVRYYTDSNGIVAFDEPGLMNQRVFFFVKSHGYEFPKDGFGMTGRMLDVKEGGAAVLKIKRVNIAERLYRITGAGIYLDTVLVGERAPIRRPLLNGGVLGQDSAMAFEWRGKLWWLWGDTGRASYPLGNFHMSGATALPPDRGGLDPSVGIDLTYFVDKDGFSRGMMPMNAPGPVWMGEPLAVKDKEGKEHLVADYSRMKDLGTVLERGLCQWDEKEEIYKNIKELDRNDQWRHPAGHPVILKDGDSEYFLFPQPYATVRVRADYESILDPEQYESYTCLAAGSKYDKSGAVVERDTGGKPAWGWKRATDPIDAPRERELIAAGKLKPEEARYQARDMDTSKPIEMHGGSIRWNSYRNKWIMIAVQTFGGPSMLGEVWFAEADSITGPWRWAKRIVTHDKYTFYNPVHHALFDQDGGRLIYFEGTYANTFSGNPDQTPRYDYNQIMYRLDLSDPRLPRPLEPK
jgi:hypothetical protein